MKILVTGGAGFIGSHLVERLHVDGHEVNIYDNLSCGTMGNLSRVPVYGFFKGDSWEIPDEWFEGSVVFHLASLADISLSMEHPFTTFQSNLQLTQYLLQRSVELGADRFIYVSSSGVYWNHSSDFEYCEKTSVDPSTPYSAQKLAGECLVRMIGYSGKLPCLSVRPFNIYGPRQRIGGTDRPVVPSFLTALCKDEQVVIEGTGRQSLDFTFVEDAARWLAGLVEADKGSLTGVPVNLGSGTTTSILDLLEVCVDVAGYGTGLIHKKSREWYFHSTKANVSFMKVFGEIPSMSLREGIERTLPYYRDLVE